jgi:hypothetical protein
LTIYEYLLNLHAIKLNVRRRVQNKKDKLDESFGDEDFDKQLEALNNYINANNVNINVNENSLTFKCKYL